MELMQAVEHYSTAMKLAERYGNEHGDVDAANNAWFECKRYEKVEEENAFIRQTLKEIVDADWTDWQELADPNEFVRWAKARAIHALHKCQTRGGQMRSEIEDGIGFSGLIESSEERRERESFARIREEARLRGRLEAFAEAMTECSKAERRDNGGMGGRDCSEIRKAIDILHLDTLHSIKKMMPICK